MDDRLATAWALLPERLGQHVLLSAAALALGLVVSLPLAVLAARRPRLRWTALTLAGLIQTIPGLALLALFYPLLLAVSALACGCSGCRPPRSASCRRCSRSPSIPCCRSSGTRWPA